MKLVELVSGLKNLDLAVKLAEAKLPCAEFDQIELYMLGNLDVESEVFLFDSDKIPGTISFEIDGNSYVNLFPLYYLQEIVEQYYDSFIGSISDREVAERIIAYRINDA